MNNILLFSICPLAQDEMDLIAELTDIQLNGGYAVSLITQRAHERPLELLQSAKYYKMPNEEFFGAPENSSYMDKVLTENHFDAVIFQEADVSADMICELCEKHHLPLYIYKHNSPLVIYNKRKSNPATRRIIEFVKTSIHLKEYIFNYSHNSKIIFYHDCGTKYTDMGTDMSLMKNTLI